MTLCLVRPVFADDGSSTDTEITLTADNSGDSGTDVISRDAEEVTIPGDPSYKVGTTPYSFTSIQDALDSMATNGTPSDRKLYIEAGTYTEDVDVDGSIAGVKGLTGLVGEGSSADEVEIDGSLGIHNTTAGFSVTNLSVVADGGLTDQIAIFSYNNNGVLTLTDVNATASGEDGTGIFAYQTGSIVLNRVVANDNGYQGANLWASGAITVLNSEFSNNLWKVNDGNANYDSDELTDAALIIGANGSSPVLLNGISAKWNDGDGVDLFAYSSIVTVKNSVFSYNGVSYNEGDDTWSQTIDGWGDGLYLFGNTVNLQNIDADHNGIRGILTVAYGTFSGGYLSTDDNFSSGLAIYTCSKGSGDTYCTNSGAGTVILKTSSGNDNGYNGVFIYSKGAVTIYDGYYSNNGSDGVYIDNSNGTAIMPVTMSFLTSNDNYGGTGITILSKGAVTGIDVIADYNGLNGLDITTSGAVTFKIDATTPSFFNETCYNTNNGYTITTSGAVSLTNFDSYNNSTGYGGYIDNTSASSAAPVTIAITNPNWSNGASSNGSYGLYIQSKGAVTLANIYGSYNSDYGLNVVTNGVVTITNSYDSNNVTYGASINNIPSTGTAKPVVNIINSTFNNNCAKDGDGNCYNDGYLTHYGLQVTSLGIINVTNLTASNNYGFGVVLDNDSIVNTAGVNVKITTGNQNETSSNLLDGLTINTYGPVVINNLTADYNEGYGLLIEDIGTGVVTITPGYFDYNLYGLKVESRGAVTWTGYGASDNYWNGASIDNSNGTGPVIITNVTTDGNGETGLSIISKGAVTLTNIESNNNSANYYWIDDGEDWTDNLTSDQVWQYSADEDQTLNIEVSSGKFTPSFYVTDISTGEQVGDYQWGSDGLVTGSVDLTAGEIYQIHILTDNSDYSGFSYWIGVYTGSEPSIWTDYSSNANGIFIDNILGTNTPVTVVNTTIYPWNGNNSGSDLEINSRGVVTVSNMELNDSSETGLYIDNSNSSSTPGVNISNVSLSSNDGDGAFINSKGVITVKNSYANANGNRGFEISNEFVSVASPVTLTGVTVESSVNSNGITVLSNGSVTFTNVTSRYNEGMGTYIYTKGAITLTGVWINYNNDYGMYIVGSPSVTVNKYGSTRNAFNGNRFDGLNITSSGKVTLNTINASSNGYWAHDDEGDYDYPMTDAYGVYISNVNTATAPAVILSDINANGNTLDGINIETSGAVTVTNVQSANGNVDNGLSIDQSAALTSAYAITLNQVTASSNGADGIYVYGKGNITLGNFAANFNYGDAGVALDNTEGTGTVTILKPSTWKTSNQAYYNSNGDGVIINSKGNVKVTGLEATGNYRNGLSITTTGSTTATVTVSNILAKSNNWDGIGIYSNGVVTVISSWVLSSGIDGLVINTPANVFINNSGSIDNYAIGIKAELSGKGILTLINSTWFGNDTGESGVENLYRNVSKLVIA